MIINYLPPRPTVGQKVGWVAPLHGKMLLGAIGGHYMLEGGFEYIELRETMRGTIEGGAF